MITRSKSKAENMASTGAPADGEHDRPPSRHSRAPSPASSIVSNRSTTSTVRRQQLLMLQLEAAEQAANVEKKAAEAAAQREATERKAAIEKRLIMEKLRLQTEALNDMDDDNLSNAGSACAANVQSTVKKAISMTSAFHTPDHSRVPDAGHAPLYQVQTDTARAPESGINKFLARQTSIKELPAFCGDPEEWPMFYSQFKSTSKLCQYSDVENIARLTKCLRGKARDAVSALLVSATNLTKIIYTLKLRFGRPEYLIEIMLHKIRAMRDIRHDDVNGLIEFSTAVQNVVAAMTATDEAGHISNTTLIREIIGKLPSILKFQWSFYLSEKGARHVTLIELSEWLMKIADAATCIAPMTKTSDRTVSVTHRHAKHAVFTTNKTRSCGLCKGDHGLNSCADFERMTVDERWQYVTENKLCFSCLSTTHQLKQCKLKKKCTLCERVHHALLHAEPLNKSAAVNHVLDFDCTILLKVVRVLISGPSGEVETLALLDEGSSISLIDGHLARRIGVTGPASALHMQGASGMKSIESSSQRVSFSVRGVNSDEIFKLINVRSVNNLALPLYKCNYKRLVNDWTYLSDFVNTDRMTVHERPLLLIGHDNIDLIVSRQVLQGPKNAPIVSTTKLGYVIHGKLPSTTPDNVAVLHLCACDELNAAIRRSFSTEGFGTKPNVDTPRSREDTRALDIMEKTTRLVGDRWETGLLWRDDKPELPDSYAVARKRLDGIERKMRRFPNFAEQYEKKIAENLQKGYISKLTDEEKLVRTNKTWYLPHFAVFNPNKPKLRLVLDCAAPSMGKSLNDFLLSGPDLLTSLPGVLLGFRCGKIAIMGDIQEMFHRVLICSEDRQAQRLLWGNDVYVMNVMSFGAVCSPSSAQYVKNLNARRFESIHPEAVKAITDHHYVDDFIYSVNSDKEAVRIVNDVNEVHAQGGFNMRNFMSNSKHLLRHLPEDKLALAGVKMLSDAKEEHIERVLGVNWDPDSDDFTFLLNLHKINDDIKSGNKRPTKREVLRLIMSVFDPLGFLLFITVKARILFQNIWKSKIGWDDEVEAHHLDKWQLWLKELLRVSTIKVPRWLMTDACENDGPVELHIFCDASSQAFCAVAYLRQKMTYDAWHISLVMARARVAPLKILSVPRLELQAAVMGARLAQVVKKYIDTPWLKISKTWYWSDSKTVLSWLRSDIGRFKPFVAHRVSEVAELTEIHDWRWVPSAMNAADDATRDGLIEDSSRWLLGPEFLRQPDDCWPKESEDEISLNEDDVEVKMVLVISQPDSLLPDDDRFSKYWRLVRSTAWVQRACYNWLQKDSRRQRELIVDEIESAQRQILKESQRRTFSADIENVKRTGLVTSDSVLRQLSPFLDKYDILRVGGRISAADVDDDMKHPIILHPKDRITKLLLMHYHEQSAHTGRERVLNEVRRRFWVLDGRTAVKSTWNICQECKNRRAKPSPPLMADLPLARLTGGHRAFTCTGLDYFGPLTVKVGRRHEKRWVALFTCLTVRAIHIEVVHSLNTSSAIMALRRFMARRGCPKEMWTDNATTFRGADKELKRSVLAIDRDVLLKFGSTRFMKWKFIPPNAPHMGGCWERLVRSVKTALRVTLKDRAPSDETLLTLLSEAEQMINSRPLTYVPIDHADDLPLTPNDFLLAKAEFDYYPAGIFDNGDLLRRSWREAQKLADLVWKRWVREYLPTLTRREKWFRPSSTALAEGDVIVIADDQLPRNLWPLGVVTKLHRGKDDRIRVVDIKTGQGHYTRPVTKLCRLDVRPSS